MKQDCKKNLLIFGSSSIIGEYLLKYLSAYHRVYSSSRRNSDFNFNLVKKNSKLKFDDEIKLDVVLVLSSIKDVRNEYSKEQNILALKKILDLCLKKNVKKIIYFSTFFLFDKSIKNSYVSYKAECERYLEKFCKSHKLAYTILRLPRLYGETLRSLRSQPFIKEILENLLLGERVNLAGKNKISRCFLSYHDLALFLELEIHDPNSKKIFLQGQTIELEKFINISKKMLNSDSEIRILQNNLNIESDLKLQDVNDLSFEIVKHLHEKDMYTLASNINFNE